MEEKKKREHLAMFGKNLAEIRKKKKLSFRQLATLCDVDYSDIKKYENGEKDLRLSTMIELSNGLGINLKELVDFNPLPPTGKNKTGKQK